MSKAKPKSAVKGVYYRDDGALRWEAKIRWREDGKNMGITKRYPIDPKALKGQPGHIQRAKADAEAYVAIERRSLATFEKPLAKRAKGWTLGDLLNRYLEDIEEGLIKHKSTKTEKSSIRMVLGLGKGKNKAGFPNLISKNIADLKYEDFVDIEGGPVETLQSGLKDMAGNKASTSSVKRVLTVIRGVLVRAKKVWKIEMDNPLESIKGLQVNDERERVITAEEWKVITQELMQHEQATQDVITFARHTAARRSEVVKLDWEDVNLKDETAILRETKSRTGKVVDRKIPLQKALPIILRRGQPSGIKKQLTIDQIVALRLKGPVFTTKKGTRIRPDTITQAWSRASKRAGIVGTRAHDLRHTRITELGRFLTAAEAARISGHTDLSTFFRYFNPDPVETGRKIKAMEKGNKNAASGFRDVAHALAALSEGDFAAAIAASVQIRTAGAVAGR